MADTATLTRRAKAARPIVAYEVTEEDEGRTEVVFHRHGIAARRVGANNLDADFEGVTCRRAPWADEFAAQGWVPASAAIARGWRFEDGCCGCGGPLDEDGLEERNLTPDRVYGGVGGLIFCCIECAADDQRQREDRQEFGAAVLQRLREKVRQRFGDVEFVTGPWRESTYVTDDFITKEATVSFNFPGQKLAPASLDWRNADMWRQGAGAGSRWREPMGPAAPTYRVCNGDREAFEAWASDLSTRPLASAQEA